MADNKNNDALEKAFDALLDTAAERAAENIGSRIENPAEEIVFSEEHERKMKKLFKDADRAARKKHKRLIRAAAIAAAIAVMAAGLYCVNAWRAYRLGFELDPVAPRTRVIFAITGGYAVKTQQDKIGYIPEGFVLAKNTSSEERTLLTFENGDMYFNIDINNFESIHSVDTENARVEKSEINGYEAMIIQKQYPTEFSTMIIWGDNKRSYLVDGNIDKEILMEIAQSINNPDSFKRLFASMPTGEN